MISHKIHLKYFRLLLFLILIAGSNLNAIAFTSGDTLSITVTGPTWEPLRPSINYICLAETTGFGTNIIPQDPNNPEELKPGIINITGISGANIEVDFALPEILLPVGGIGKITASYTNQSAALIDLNTGRPYKWFNPTYPLNVVLDSSGRTQIWLVANLDVSPDVLDGDCFYEVGIVQAEYIDSTKEDSSNNILLQTSKEIEFWAMPMWGSGALTIVNLSAPVLWSGLRPGISYTCTTDSVCNIHPVAPLHPESIMPGILEVFGAPGAQVLLHFLLPATLTPKDGFGHISMSYDSTSIRVIDPTDKNIRTHQWIRVPDSLVATLSGIGNFQVIMVGNLTVSPDVFEGDTLYGNGLVTAEYTGLSSKSLLREPLHFLQTESDVEYRAIIRGNILARFALSQNYPNPFNNSTVIFFSIPVNDHVNIIVYDLLGRNVKTLVNDSFSAGEHSVQFNGDNMPSGMYFYRITAGHHTEVKKMMVMK